MFFIGMGVGMTAVAAIIGIGAGIQSMIEISVREETEDLRDAVRGLMAEVAELKDKEGEGK